MSLKDTIKLKEGPLVESYPPEGTMPEDGLYHYLLQPSKEHNDQRKRATDRIWSSPGNRAMYYSADGLENAFIKEELMLIPKDTELPHDFVQKW